MLDEICANVESLQKNNKHITPTVNDIYDTLLRHFPWIKKRTQQEYECIREAIIKEIKTNVDKRASLKESISKILRSMASCLNF